MIVKRGEIWFADLSKGRGSEQNGVRPVLIIQNDTGNFFSPTVIVSAITSKTKNNIPTHVVLDEKCGLPKKSVAMLEQIRTLDKCRLIEKVGRVDMSEVDYAIAISTGLIPVAKNTKTMQSVCFA